MIIFEMILKEKWKLVQAVITAKEHISREEALALH